MVVMPNKEANKTPNSQLKIPQKTAKKAGTGQYDCPKCSRQQLLIFIDKTNKQTIAHCHSCNLDKTLKYAPIFQVDDYYNMLLDAYNKDTKS